MHNSTSDLLLTRLCILASNLHIGQWRPVFTIRLVYPSSFLSPIFICICGMVCLETLWVKRGTFQWPIINHWNLLSTRCINSVDLISSTTIAHQNSTQSSHKFMVKFYVHLKSYSNYKHAHWKSHRIIVNLSTQNKQKHFTLCGLYFNLLED